jgi:cytochrome c-type biogenesis protein CcmH
MTMFWIAALVLVIAALLFLLPPLMRRRPAAGGIDNASSNLAILRDQRTELDKEMAAGNLSPEQHDIARKELERRVLEEVDAAGSNTVTRRAVTSAALLAVGVPLFAVALYLHLGNSRGLAPQAAATAADSGQSVSNKDIEAMVEGLAKKLQSQPDSGEGWAMLARSYGTLQRYDEAARAYARAVELLPKDAGLLADYADALAMAQGRNPEGEPWLLIQKALKIDPNNVKALALAGSVAFERRDYAAAQDYWQKAVQAAPPDSEFARFLREGIIQAKAQAGSRVATEEKPAPIAAGSRADSLSGRVVLSPALATKVAPGDRVFVYARAAEGPRMPLAILMKSAGELPISFTLDDSLAMAPELKLSKFDRVVVTARVTKSGDAAARSGDLQGQVGPIRVGSQDVEIVIDKIAP